MVRCFKISRREAPCEHRESACIAARRPTDFSPGARALEKVANQLHLAALALLLERDYDRAAERLQIPVFEFRKRIARLEDKLCLVLFVPDTNPVEMTDLGHRYLEQVRKSHLARGLRL